MKPISFEYFPPKTQAGMENLIQTTQTLKTYQPEFFSVTYGAAGSMQDRTLNTIQNLRKTCQTPLAPHISCIGATKAIIRDLLAQYQAHGLKHLVVLRGDHPDGQNNTTDDFKYAYQLVEFIREETGSHFFIEVAVYPEFHPETPDPIQHIKHFQQKISAGANRAITQYFYNFDAYLHLLDDCEKHQINIPIIPGIMPITNYTQLARFSNMCGAEIPRWLRCRLEKFADDPIAITKIGTEFIGSLCEKLLAQGAPGLHFYTLNKANPTIEILETIANPLPA